MFKIIQCVSQLESRSRLLLFSRLELFSFCDKSWSHSHTCPLMIALLKFIHTSWFLRSSHRAKVLFAALAGHSPVHTSVSAWPNFLLVPLKSHAFLVQISSSSLLYAHVFSFCCTDFI